MKKIFLLGLSLVFCSTSVFAQTTAFNFDSSADGFASITRPDTYDDEPVSADSGTATDYPAAFPPTSGSNVLVLQDVASDSFGLCSAVGGTIFDRTNNSLTSATLSGDIFIPAVSSSTTEGNYSILAINDGTGGLNEAYYRFGYRNNEVFLQKFTGAFTTLGQDATIDDTNMTIPGWNRFTMTFIGSDTIEFSVNGVAPSFSPITDTEPLIDTEMQLGFLGFFLSSFNPMYVDSAEEVLVPTASVSKWKSYE